jgi:ankyrin repeat protein
MSSSHIKTILYVFFALASSTIDLNSTPPNQRLFDAVKAQDASKAAQALNDGANPDFRKKDDVENLSALWLALTKNDIAIIKLLLDAGANPHQTMHDGTPMLSLAHSNEAASLLLAAGANPHQENNNGESAFTEAITEKQDDRVQLFLKTGARTNKATQGGFTLLTLAINEEATKIVQLLLEADADPNMPDSTTTPLKRAVQKQHAAIVALLLQHKATPVCPVLGIVVRWRPNTPEKELIKEMLFSSIVDEQAPPESADYFDKIYESNQATLKENLERFDHPEIIDNLLKHHYEDTKSRFFKPKSLKLQAFDVVQNSQKSYVLNPRSYWACNLGSATELDWIHSNQNKINKLIDAIKPEIAPPSSLPDDIPEILEK